MQNSHIRSATSGAAMDTRIVRPKRSPLILAAIVCVVVLCAAGLYWYVLPHGLQVDAADVRIAKVEQGNFRDDVNVRGSAEPLNSVLLDSVEAGRVEEVLLQDGEVVPKGKLLFRLSNPQRSLDLLARQAEYAQQISNLSNLKVAQESRLSDNARRLADLEFALSQAQKKHARNVLLAGQGFLSAAAIEESSDELAQSKRRVEEERVRAAAELKVQGDAINQLTTATERLQSGLALVKEAVEALAVRAPAPGRLTGFHLQVGQAVTMGQEIGRIDDPSKFKLVAKVDEFYLGRIRVGQQGVVRQNNEDFPAKVNTIFPQITDGRFTVELVFDPKQPAMLSPGQNVDLQITLGEPSPAIILPNGAFINTTGGAWVFVVDSSGRRAERRAISIGRRTGSQIEVRSGLKAGEKVIVSDYRNFGSATSLAISQ